MKMAAESRKGMGILLLAQYLLIKYFKSSNFKKKQKKRSVMVSKSASIACISLRNILRMNYIRFLPSSVNLR